MLKCLLFVSSKRCRGWDKGKSNEKSQASEITLRISSQDSSSAGDAKTEAEICDVIS